MHLIGACRKIREQAEKRTDWLGRHAGLPWHGRREMQPRPTRLTAIFKLCDRPWRAMVGDAGAMRARAGGLTVSGLQQQADRDILEGIVHAVGDLSDARAFVS